MERVRYVAHAGERILYVDYSGIRDVAELELTAQEGTRVVQAEPSHSVPVLLDLTDVPFGLRIVRKLGEAAAANADFVCARAVVGLPDGARSTAAAIAAFTGRPLRLFGSVPEALDWLSKQASVCRDR